MMWNGFPWFVFVSEMILFGFQGKHWIFLYTRKKTPKPGDARMARGH